MKIGSPTILKSTRLTQTATQQVTATPPGGKSNFSGVLDSVRNGSTDIHTELVGFQKKILSGEKFSNQDLLYFQVRAGEYGMKVELFSKLAESLSGTLKKFQQGNS